MANLSDRELLERLLDFFYISDGHLEWGHVEGTTVKELTDSRFEKQLIEIKESK